MFWDLNSGGCAGALSWLFMIPQDAIKTKQQCHNGFRPLPFHQAVNRLIKEGGIRRIFKGIGPILARGYIVNMVTLPLYDGIKRHLEADS